MPLIRLESVTYVSERVLPIHPVYTSRRERGFLSPVLMYRWWADWRGALCRLADLGKAGGHILERERSQRQVPTSGRNSGSVQLNQNHAQQE